MQDLQKNGKGPVFRGSSVSTLQRTLCLLFSLFTHSVFHNSFRFTGIHALSRNCRVYPNSSHSGTAHSSLATILKFFFSHSCALFCAFLHVRKTQLIYFQSLPHSLRKTTGGGGGSVLL